MKPMPHLLHFRTLQIALGIALLAAWFAHEWQERRTRSHPRTHQPWPHPARLQALRTFADIHYHAILVLLTGTFAVLASVAKFSQLHELELSANDFWLFQDMLVQMMRGGFQLTHYAPQARGWVQHAAVHPYPTWGLAIPLAWIVGPTAAALLWGPLVSAAAGTALAAIARPRWGALGALAAATAYLSSNQVARTLMYEVHPESAYPLFALLWAWAAGWGDQKLRPSVLLLSTLALLGIKEDAFAVLFPLMLATAIWVKPQRRAWFAASAVIALGLCAFQFFAIHQWSSGAWGPHSWRGSPVTVPHGAELMRNQHWESASSAVSILEQVVAEKGGILGAVGSFARFMFSRPWLSLLLVAPWVLAQPAFWVSVLPLAAIYSLLDDPGKFINYYSAPVLGLFWLAAISARRPRASMALWLLSSSLALGGAGLIFYLPTDSNAQIRQETRDLAPCLAGRGPGIVSSRLFDMIDADKIYSDRVPEPPRDEAVDFYLFSPARPSFEISPVISALLLERFQKAPKWVPLGKNCLPLSPEQNPRVLLFVKSP